MKEPPIFLAVMAANGGKWLLYLPIRSIKRVMDKGNEMCIDVEGIEKPIDVQPGKNPGEIEHVRDVLIRHTAC